MLHTAHVNNRYLRLPNRARDRIAKVEGSTRSRGLVREARYAKAYLDFNTCYFKLNPVNYLDFNSPLGGTNSGPIRY